MDPSDPRTRRRFLGESGRVILGASAVGGLLAGSGGSLADAAVSARPDSAGSRLNASGSFTYWTAFASPEIAAYFKNTTVPAFKKAYPAIQLNYSTKPLQTLTDVTKTAIQAGRAPDLIVAAGPGPAAQYAANGLVLPLDSYAQQLGWKKKILPWAYNSGVLDGKLFSIPSSYETLVIYYNKTLFAEKKLSIPRSRAELEALATELKASGITPFMAGNAEFKPATEWFVTMALNNYAGPDALHDALAGKKSFTDPIFVDAITMVNDWFQKGWFGGGVSRYFSNRFASQYASLAKGNSAMDMEGSWALTQWGDYFGKKAGNKNDWDWFPIPPLRKGVPAKLYTLATGGTYSVNAKSKNPDAVVQYLDWLYSTPKRVAEQVAATNDEPLPIRLTNADYPSGTDARLRRMYVDFGAATSAGTFGYTSWTFFGPKADTWLYTGMEKVLTRQMTPQAYLSELQSIHTKELAAKATPPLVPQGRPA